MGNVLSVACMSAWVAAVPQLGQLLQGGFVFILSGQARQLLRGVGSFVIGQAAEQFGGGRLARMSSSRSCCQGVQQLLDAVLPGVRCGRAVSVLAPVAPAGLAVAVPAG
jgi:hypothetical protein